MATILVVDHRPTDRELLVTLLEHQQHRVLEAADGAQALRLVQAEPPDLVIADVLLPQIDGYQLVRQLRADPAISATPVIFYTARFNEREAQELARELGVALVLAKPTDPEKILKSVSEVLKGKDIEKSPSLPAGFDQKHQQLLIDKLLQQVNELEQRLAERTSELKTAVDLLEEEVKSRQQMEEEIRVLNEELEMRVQERTGKLEAANRELEAFSYSVSHDLKAPIRAIDGFSRILLTGYGALLDAEGRRLLKVICTNTKIMGQLIDDLLGLSHLGRKRMRKMVFNLGALSRQVFNNLKVMAPGRSLQLIVTDLPPAYGDLSLLNQVLINFLVNAIKFTKSRKTAIIEVGGWTEGLETIYYVKDNGIGFDERYV
ncbi:MAG: response regulator, partial [Deltaproteobacteria bacterium]|nr:response regulator [Deltaproteobacteria bacterium]